MDETGATQEIQAAIDRLTALKAESTPGPWHEWQNDLTDRVQVWHDQGHRLWVADLGEYHPALIDAELIVTLHATIDAQLAILEAAAGGNHDTPALEACATLLAHAINGSGKAG